MRPLTSQKEYLRYLKNHREKLRSKPTPAEIRFKPILKTALKELSIKAFISFQYLFTDIKSSRKSYIIDYFISSLGLAFEIDGGYHDNDWQQTYDLFKNQALAQENILIVRITNEETENFNTCKQKIKEIIIRRKGIRHLRSPHSFSPVYRPCTDKQLDYLKDQYFKKGGKITVVPDTGQNRRFKDSIKQYSPYR